MIRLRAWSCVWLWLIVPWLTACDGPLSNYGQLEARLQRYYQAEQAGDWAQVYALRVRDFRWTVSEAYFVNAMRKDAAGWALLDYRVLAAQENGATVRVSLRFRYRVPAQDTAWARRADAQGIVAFEDDAHWVFEDDAWYCQNAGVRRHLPMSETLQ